MRRELATADRRSSRRHAALSAPRRERYRFAGGFHGDGLSSNLVVDPSDKTLYGATSTGGYQNAGTVFEVHY